MAEKFKIAIIGAGPAGLSAAARAAELGISHILLDAGQRPANTIHKFQKGKFVMAEPAILPLRSPITFSAGTRESILKQWNEDIQKNNVNLRLGAQVNGINGERGNFEITLSTGEGLNAEFVVLAIGLQGNIRKLGVVGEDLSNVQYQLDDPEEFRNETIVVVGGGDAGVENALALARQNQVILINREEEFSRCKEGNFNLLQAAFKTGQIVPRVSAKTDHVENAPENGFLLKYVVKTPEGLENIPCHRVIARLGATPPRKLVESFGVKFPNSDVTSVPELSERYESNVPGLHIVGALGGYPLIKQALNQGYEVIEHILDHPVEPADESLLKQKIACFHASCSVSEGLAMIKRNVPVLDGLTMLQLRELLIESSVSKHKAGEIIFKRNDYTNSFYSVVEGELAALIENVEGNESRSQINAGNFFGEIGLISGRRRSATIMALSDCVLIETPRRSMIRLINSVESVQRNLDEVSLKRIVRSCLTDAIPADELDSLVKTATIKRYKNGEVLFHQGDNADGLYLIRRGSVVVSQIRGIKEDVLSYVVAGNFVGEMALVSDQPRTATVRAAAPTEVIMLDASQVAAMLERNASVRDLLATRYRENISHEESIKSQKKDNLFDFLLRQGVGEATDVLLIDYSLCVRCDNCETSCAETHGGTSMLNREAGPTHGYIHLPTSCRHCEHPHCMKDCPPDAIHRSVNGEVFISDSCIGCGNCKNNCPYGVIQMAVIDPAFKKKSLWQILLGGVVHAKENGVPAKELAKKAVKCDMCKENVLGPACVRSCPTGAAMRVSPETFSLTMSKV